MVKEEKVHATLVSQICASSENKFPIIDIVRFEVNVM